MSAIDVLCFNYMSDEAKLNEYNAMVVLDKVFNATSSVSLEVTESITSWTRPLPKVSQVVKRGSLEELELTLKLTGNTDIMPILVRMIVKRKTLTETRKGKLITLLNHLKPSVSEGEALLIHCFDMRAKSYYDFLREYNPLFLGDELRERVAEELRWGNIDATEADYYTL